MLAGSCKRMAWLSFGSRRRSEAVLYAFEMLCFCDAVRVGDIERDALCIRYADCIHDTLCIGGTVCTRDALCIKDTVLGGWNLGSCLAFRKAILTFILVHQASVSASLSALSTSSSTHPAAA